MSALSLSLSYRRLKGTRISNHEHRPRGHTSWTSTAPLQTPHSRIQLCFTTISIVLRPMYVKLSHSKSASLRCDAHRLECTGAVVVVQTDCLHCNYVGTSIYPLTYEGSWLRNSTPVLIFNPRIRDYTETIPKSPTDGKEGQMLNKPLFFVFIPKFVIYLNPGTSLTEAWNCKSAFLENWEKLTVVILCRSLHMDSSNQRQNSLKSLFH